MGTIASSMLTIPDMLILSLESAVPPIVGRCVGAGNPKDAKRMTFVCVGIAMTLGGGFLLISAPFYPILVKSYSPTPEMISMIPILYFSHGIMRCLFGPTSTSAAAALRASGDASYATIGAMVSMWCVKIVLGYILGIYLGGGILGLWIAGYAEWVVRSIFFVSRIHSKHWCKKKLV
jgi:Na+-driven multidrug efflux pump